jgi:hypothetical protein
MVRVEGLTRARSRGARGAGQKAQGWSLLQHTDGAPAEGPWGRRAVVWSSVPVFAGEGGSPWGASARMALALL